MAKYFSTQLEGFACGMGAVRLRVQNGTAIAKTCHTLTVQQVRINAGNLRRGVGTQSHHAARQLIHQLEGLQIMRLTRA